MELITKTPKEIIFFERNCKIMSEYQKGLLEKMQSPENKNSFPDIQIGFGQNEQGTMDNVVVNINQQLFVAGTKAEAKIWIDGINTNSNTFVIFGLGLGYHIEELMSKFPDATIYVIEPDKRVFGHALHLRDFEKILKRCTILLDEPVQNIKIRLFEMVTRPLSRGIAVIPFYSLIYKEYSDVLYSELQKMMNDWAVMTNTKRTLADKWYNNRIKNSRRDSVNMASLMGKFKGVPAILVGAAPSLQGQIETLRKLQGKAVIIAASTAAEILKTHGIKPTFMIAIDQDPVTSGALHENMDGDTPLIFDGQVAQNSLDYKGKKFQMLLNVNRYTGLCIKGLPVIESAPSVANVALDVLYKLGCSPICIIGMDMSYTNNKLYCDGTRFNKNVESSNGLMQFVGIDGNICYTEPAFMSMRNWFEEYVPRVKPPVFNCTTAGLPIAGMEHKKLEDFDFSKDYCFDSIIDSAYYKSNSSEPDLIDLSELPKIEQGLLDELDLIESQIKQTNAITPSIAVLKAWLVLEEFVGSSIYLHEIRAEYKIATGKLEPDEAIREFQAARTKTVLEQIEVVRTLLKE